MDSEAGSKSVIDSQVEITGTVKTPGNIQIDGKLNGDAECGGDVIIGKSAQIKGNMQVNSVTIAGTVQGNVTAKDRIELKSSAKMTGDIKAKRLAVEDGVTFIGKSEVNPGGAPVAAPKNDDAPAAEKKDDSADDKKAGMFNRKS